MRNKKVERKSEVNLKDNQNKACVTGRQLVGSWQTGLGQGHELPPSTQNSFFLLQQVLVLQLQIPTTRLETAVILYFDVNHCYETKQSKLMGTDMYKAADI